MSFDRFSNFTIVTVGYKSFLSMVKRAQIVTLHGEGLSVLAKVRTGFFGDGQNLVFLGESQSLVFTKKHQHFFIEEKTRLQTKRCDEKYTISMIKFPHVG